jgi:hypothetical protein
MTPVRMEGTVVEKRGSCSSGNVQWVGEEHGSLFLQDQVEGEDKDKKRLGEKA